MQTYEHFSYLIADALQGLSTQWLQMIFLTFMLTHVLTVLEYEKVPRSSNFFLGSLSLQSYNVCIIYSHMSMETNNANFAWLRRHNHKNLAWHGELLKFHTWNIQSVSPQEKIPDGDMGFPACWLENRNCT